jgi:hypothetical protein
MSVVGGDHLDDLCLMATDAARARGHELGDWATPSGEEMIARNATCVRCGRTAYVRSESGLAGAGGRALTEACSAPDPREAD